MKQFTQVIINTLLLILVLIFIISTSCQKQDPIRAFKPITEKYIEVWCTGNLDLLDNIIDTYFVRHESPSSTSGANGLDSLKNVIISIRKSFPDFHMTLEEEIYVDDKSVLRWSYTATNTGPELFYT